MSAVNTLIQMLVNSFSAPGTLFAAFPSVGTCLILFLLVALWLASGFLTLRQGRPVLTFIFGLILPVVAPLLMFLCERGWSFRKANSESDDASASAEDVQEIVDESAPLVPNQQTFVELQETNSGVRIQLVDGSVIVASAVVDPMPNLCVLTLENGQTVRMPYSKMESLVKQ